MAALASGNQGRPNSLGEGGERIDAMIGATPAKRAGTADEIADAVVYFECDEFYHVSTDSCGWRP